DQLTAALRSIGAQVAISCDLPLSETPEDPDLVNVYFDDQVVPKSDADGWRYRDENTIQFVGATCDALAAGDVLNVQVFSGARSTTEEHRRLGWPHPATRRRPREGRARRRSIQARKQPRRLRPRTRAKDARAPVQSGPRALGC